MKNKIILHKGLFLLSCMAVLCLSYSCKSNKIEKEKAIAKDLETLESLYEQNDYRIAIQVVYPFTSVATTQVTNLLLTNTGDTANRIDVRGDGNFIEIKNDSVKAYLPFFGESRINSGDYPGANLSIQFNEPLKDLEKQIVPKKGKLQLKFNAKQKNNSNEKYQINLDIYPNKSVIVNITPIYKTFIRYSGILVPIDEKKKS